MGRDRWPWAAGSSLDGGRGLLATAAKRGSCRCTRYFGCGGEFPRRGFGRSSGGPRTHPPRVPRGESRVRAQRGRGDGACRVQHRHRPVRLSREAGKGSRAWSAATPAEPPGDRACRGRHRKNDLRVARCRWTHRPRDLPAARQRSLPGAAGRRDWPTRSVEFSIVRSVLRNPKYLGRQVWGRRRHGRWVPSGEWVWSPVWAHPPIVSAEEFIAANPRSTVSTALASADNSAIDVPVPTAT